MKQEVFIKLEKYPGYMLSNFGRVKRLEYTSKNGKTIKERIIVPSNKGDTLSKKAMGRSGYIRFVVGNRTELVSVAELVATNFIDGFSKETHVIRYIDGDSLNAKLDNLVTFPKYLVGVEKQMLRSAAR